LKITERISIFQAFKFGPRLLAPLKWGFRQKSLNPHFYIALQAPSNKGLKKKVNLFLWFDNRHFFNCNEFLLERVNFEFSVHIAPSLMISGKSNKQTDNIKESIEKRYCVNVLFDLFYSATYTFSKRNITNLRKTGKMSPTGIYTYKLNYKLKNQCKPKTISGHVNLIR
jgi:hypothetical protein